MDTNNDTKTEAPQESFRAKGESHVVGARELPPLLRDIPAEELEKMQRKLVRKLDLRLMAPLILMYIMNYLDR